MRNRPDRHSFFLILVTLLLHSRISGVSAPAAAVVTCPPNSSAKPLYPANRAPLTPSPFIKLPIGSITPKGWLRSQLQLEADGMTGHLEEISQWCKFEDSAWASPTGQGKFGWEELPYWLKGFGDLGYVLKDEKIIARARRWIDAALARNPTATSARAPTKPASTATPTSGRTWSCSTCSNRSTSSAVTRAFCRS